MADEMTMKMKTGVLMMACVAWLAPAAAVGAPDGEVEEEDGHRVAVVALDESVRAGSVMQTVSGLLDNARFDVMVGDRLEDVLASRQVDAPPAAVATKFSGLANVIADGVEQFFYKGNEAAIEKLAPVFDMGMAHLDVLARRPDFADQIFQAGLVMIRSYKNLGQEENAAAVAKLLVKSLPGLEPSPATAPPKIIRFLHKHRDELASSGTTLSVQMVEGEDCTAFINGTPVEERPYPVASEMTYMVTMDCGGSTAPVWKISLAEGDEAVVPVSARDPLSFEMGSGEFRERRRAESYLRLVAFWSGAPRVLGVTRAAAVQTEETVVFVRVAPDGDAAWSDGTDERAISRGLARVLPTYREEVGDGPVADIGDGPSEVDWFGWSLVGGGVALGGVGIWATLAAEDRAMEVECSPDTVYGTSTADCEGVPVIRFADQQELEQAESEVTIARIGGYGALSAGIGLAAWGVWRLASTEVPPEDDGLTVQARPVRGGAIGAVRWRF